MSVPYLCSCGLSGDHWFCQFFLSTPSYCLVGLVVKASAMRTASPGFDSHLLPDFCRSSHTSDLKIGTPVDTLPGAWHFWVSTWTGWPGVSMLSLCEMESLICNFYLSVTACACA